MSSLKFGAKTMNDWTPQESLAPYIKAIVSSGAEVSPSRAIINKGDAGPVTLTIGGEDVAIFLNMFASRWSNKVVIYIYNYVLHQRLRRDQVDSIQLVKLSSTILRK